MRKITRQAIIEQGVEMVVGKRRKGQAQRSKLIEWSDDLRAVMREALSLQRTTSMYVFGNSDGQPYTTSGWNTNLRRLMEHAMRKAGQEKLEFSRFTLKDMRPAAVTDRVDAGDENITNATGHSSDRMVRQVYDRRKKKTAKATE
jgi:integrase